MRRITLAVLCLLLLISASATKKEETVSFNVNSSKYHCLTCSAAKRCTRSCVEMSLSEAKKRGGVACKLCGGTCGS